MHDPRLDSSFGVVYQAEPTPGRHTVVSQAKGSLAANTAYVNLANASGLCLFGLRIGCGTSVCDWVNAATGWLRSEEEYLEIGHRILALRQAFNLREGIDPRSIRLPQRILGKPPTDNEAMLEDYYRQLRWDPATGRPTGERLQQLGLGDVFEVICRTEK
jgi:aldehyde:ferredoxin oxidoreductase